MNTRTLAIALTGAFLLAGCSDDVTGPDDGATVQAFMADDPGSAQVEGPSQAALSSSATYSGNFNADATVEISADGETWIDLGSPAEVSVGLQASEDRAEVHGETEVPADTYTHVRLVVEGADATIDAGSEIGPITLDAAVTMDIGSSGEVTVEKEVPPFEVSAETRTEITWNLNSHLWVNEENTEEEEVEEEEFEESSEPETERYPREEAH